MSELNSEIEILRAKIAELEEQLVCSKIVSRSIIDPEHRFNPPPLSEEQIKLVDNFNEFAYDIADQGLIRTYFSSWMGHEMFKWPTDLWSYQEIIVRTRPTVIIETGTYRGGSALFLASICDLMDRGMVISIDIDATLADIRPPHPRIKYITGSSTDPNVVAEVERLVADQRAMVILDSDHRFEHVIKELEIYEKFVPPGNYLIVEDTIVNGHPAYHSFGAGPWEAVQSFTKATDNFIVDRSAERVYLTQNPGGYLYRQS